MKRQKGYTLVELAMVGGLLASAATFLAVIAVAVHFAAKYW